MDPKIIEPYQCSLERSHTVSVELNINLIPTKAKPSLDKQIRLLDIKIYKNKVMKILYTIT